jgi:hypothetical protein
LIAVVIALSLEALAAGFLQVMQQREGRVFAFDIDAYVAAIPEAQIQGYADARQRGHIYAPDPLLGWIRNPRSTHTFPDGSVTTTDALAARTSRSSGPAIVAVYGDSFTEGLEVDDDETWAEALGSLRGARVLNFGVSGYGPDQAVLLLERNLERGIGRTPVVVLAMINENLIRLLITYRPFFSHPFPDLAFGFKPIFLETAAGFETRTFMPGDLLDRGQLAASMREASRYDPYWAARTERSAFPHVVHAIGFLRRQGLHPRQPELATSDTARSRMRYALERFVAASRRYAFRPVLVMLAERGSEFAERGGRPHPFLQQVAAAPGLQGLEQIDVVALLSGPERDRYVPGFDAAQYIETTHASAYGCSAIAAVLDRALGAIPSPPVEPHAAAQ